MYFHRGALLISSYKYTEVDESLLSSLFWFYHLVLHLVEILFAVSRTSFSFVLVSNHFRPKVKWSTMKEETLWVKYLKNVTLGTL